MRMFRDKIFNPEVFERYLKTLPSTKENSLIKNGLFTPVNKYKQIMADQVGTHFVVEPIKGRIGGEPVNYDGNTNIVTSERETYYQTKIAFGRANGWKEYDFSTDITGGVNFMAEAGEVKEYWDEQLQKTVLSMLKGIFSMTGNNNFATRHTFDISNETDPNLGADSINRAAQKALGDKKGKLEMMFTHSVVSTNLEGLNLINFLKYTDADGIERDLTIGTYNGKLVIVDDEMPVGETVTTEPVYSLTVSTAATAGDKITIDGVEYTFVANDSTETGNVIKVGASGTAAQQATNIAALLNGQTAGLKDLFTIAASSSKVTFTGKNDTAPEQPTISATKGEEGTLVIANATDTPAVVDYVYTSYVFRKGFFEFEEIGAKVPTELVREAKEKGGYDELISRKRYMIAPTYISFVNSAKISPENSDFEEGSNWGIANNNKQGENRLFVDSKLIPIVRIISKG